VLPLRVWPENQAYRRANFIPVGRQGFPTEIFKRDFQVRFSVNGMPRRRARQSKLKSRDSIFSVEIYTAVSNRLPAIVYQQTFSKKIRNGFEKDFRELRTKSLIGFCRSDFENSCFL
jgi:hypothetical protein